MSLYRPDSNSILNLLEDLEKKLNKNKPSNSIPRETDIFKDNQFKFNQDYPFNNSQNNFDKITPSMEYNIRKIIRDEFSSLILPYQQELHEGMNLMDSKVDKNSNEIKDLKLKNINNFDLNSGSGLNFNQPNPFDNDQYVLRVEYNNKINELEIQITTLNSFSSKLKEALDNKLVGDNNYSGREEFGQKLNEIQNQFNSISGEINQIKKNIFNFNQSLNDVNINSNKLKNDLLNEMQNIKNDFSEKVQDMNNNFKNVNGIIQNQSNSNEVNGKIQNVNIALNNLKNEFDVFTKQLDMNFMASLKTIVNQHVTIAEFNVVKNKISGFENNVNDIMDKNYDIEINNIKNSLNSLENKINNINLNNKSSNEMGEINGTNNNNNINLDENKLNLLNELQNIDIRQLQRFDFDSVNELKNEINIIKNNNENLVLLKTKINQLDTEINKLKEKIDFDQSISELKNNIINIKEKIKKLEAFHLKSSNLVVEPINEENIGNNNNTNINRNNNNFGFNKRSNKEIYESDSLFLNKKANQNNMDKNNFDINDDEIEEPEEDNAIKDNNKAHNNNEEEKKENNENKNDKTNNKDKNTTEEFDIGDLDDILIGD